MRHMKKRAVGDRPGQVATEVLLMHLADAACCLLLLTGPRVSQTVGRAASQSPRCIRCGDMCSKTRPIQCSCSPPVPCWPMLHAHATRPCYTHMLMAMHIHMHIHSRATDLPHRLHCSQVPYPPHLHAYHPPGPVVGACAPQSPAVCWQSST